MRSDKVIIDLGYPLLKLPRSIPVTMQFNHAAPPLGFAQVYEKDGQYFAEMVYEEPPGFSFLLYEYSASYQLKDNGCIIWEITLVASGASTANIRLVEGEEIGKTMSEAWRDVDYSLKMLFSPIGKFIKRIICRSNQFTKNSKSSDKS